MAVAELFALKEQLAPQRLQRPDRTRCRGALADKRPPTESPPHPARRSLANTIRALRYCLHHLDEQPRAGQELEALLRRAVTDHYQRQSTKRSRRYRLNPDKKPLGNPKLRKITDAERKQLTQHPFKLAA